MNSPIDENFQKKLTQLKEGSEKLNTEGLSGKGQAPWQLFDDKPGKTDFAKQHEEFSRDAIEKRHKELLDKRAPFSTVGEVQIQQLQSDYLAAMERDFIMRHRSRLRMLAHESGRRYTMGHDKGPIQNVMLPFVNNLIKLVDENLA